MSPHVSVVVHGTRTQSVFGMGTIDYDIATCTKKRWQMRCLKASALEGILALPTPTSRMAVRLEIEGKREKVALGAVKKVTLFKIVSWINFGK